MTSKSPSVAASAAAAESLSHAADFLAHAATLIASGEPAECTEVARWEGFAKRKVWQGREELAGRRFAFRI